MWSRETFEREIKKFDPMLRLRDSKTEPGIVYIERKAARNSACVPTPRERQGIDNWRRNCEGHVLVMRVRKNELGRHVFLELRAHDMWEFRGAGPYADALAEQERREQEEQKRKESTILQEAGEEAYDRAMIRQGDVVSNFHQKV